MTMRPNDQPAKCTDCREPLAGIRRGLCQACKELNRLLHQLHRKPNLCEADRLEKPKRVAHYQAVVAMGGRLFEPGEPLPLFGKEFNQ